jgi:hypothetical protein
MTMKFLSGRRLFVLLLLASVMLNLSGHAFAGIRDPAPPRVDPFTGILDRQSLAAGESGSITGASALNVAVLLSENTRQHIAWCQQQTGGVKGADRAVGSLFSNAQAMSDYDRAHQLAYDPKFVTDGVTQPLVHRFRSFKLVDSVEEFHQGNYDLLIVLDVSFVNTFSDGFFIGAKYETGTFLNSYFINQQGALIGHVETGEKRAVPRESFLPKVAELRQEILTRYQGALNTLLGPETATIIRTSTPATPAPASSVAERLKAVHDLLQQGLITAEQAEQKKEEILKAL